MNGGKTLGMAVWNFEIYSTDGGEITLKKVSIRFFSNIFTILLAGLPLALIYFSKDNLSLSDCLSKTSYKKI
jgi:uncharacterized RDD family membrane protein YckC